MTENSYTLTHDTAERTMTFHMSAGFKVLVDLRNSLVVTSQNGEVKDKKTFEEMGSLADFEHHIEMTDKDAKELKEKGLAND